MADEVRILAEVPNESKATNGSKATNESKATNGSIQAYLVADDVSILAEAPSADSWATTAFAIQNNLCCYGRQDVELGTPATTIEI